MTDPEGQPSPIEHFGVSEADMDALKADALKYNEIYLKTILEDDGNLISRSESYQHLMGNLAWFCQIILKDRPENRTQEKYQRFVEDMLYIKKYLKLLEDFPDFREKEMSTGKGYFTKIETSDHKKRIDEYEVLLRGEGSS